MEEKIEEAVVEPTTTVVESTTTVVEPTSVPMDENEVEETTPVEAVATSTEVEDDVELLKVRIAELIQENDELKIELSDREKHEVNDLITKDECEKRVSGMQSSMQKQINDFVNQLKVKDEELNQVKAELTSLNQKLEESNWELSKMASALEEKKNALAQLNAGVLRQSDELPTFKEGLANCHSPAEKVAFINSKKYKI